MKTKNLLKITSILMISGILAATSCNEEDRITAQDTNDISEEASTDSYFQDMDDMGSVAVSAPSDAEYSGGREKGTFTIDDNRFKCGSTPLTLTLVRGANSTPYSPNGTITVDFGTSGCTDARGNVRTGKLIFTYNGRRYVPGSTMSVTGENYAVNGIKLEGTRTTTNEVTSTTEAPKFRTVLTDGKATFENGEVATRSSNIVWQWVRAANPLEDQLIIDQTSVAQGTTRGGRAYAVSLIKELLYKRACALVSGNMAVSGVKKYIIDGEKEIIIDYGDGSCDREVKVTVNGVVKNIRVN